MRPPLSRLLLLLLLLPSLAAAAAALPRLPAPQRPLPPAPSACTPALRRSIGWGLGSSAYQTEGASDGRAPTIWDAYTKANPSAIADRSNATRGVGAYARADADAALLAALSVRHVRLSVSWARLVPGGVAGSPINAAAAAHYRRLVASLRAAGAEVLVVLYHWDLPQVLQDSYGGFLDRRVVRDFSYYADAAFKLLGPLGVSRWLTFVEPAVICSHGYAGRSDAPGLGLGDAGRFACGHHVLLAHAAAAEVYRNRYAASQGGALSFSTLLTWPRPDDARSAADAAAAQAKLDFDVGAWLVRASEGERERAS
jgi:beta-glucosidase